MAQFSAIKSTIKKSKKDLSVSRNLSQYGSTPFTNINKDRLSLMSNPRLHKGLSNSLSRLSFVSEKEDNVDHDNYKLNYKNYLLKSLQLHIISKNKEEKEEHLKKHLVFLKKTLEELLGNYVKLSKESGYFQMFLEALNEVGKKTEDGYKVLKFLKENDFETLLKSISSSLDHTINELQLIDFDRTAIEDAFEKKVWGFESALDVSLRQINSWIDKYKDDVSKIAAELAEMKKLMAENVILRERFHSVFSKLSSEILDTNYKTFTEVVKHAFHQREVDSASHDLDCDLGFLFTGFKIHDPSSLQISKFDGSYAITPNSASTPQHSIN